MEGSTDMKKTPDQMNILCADLVMSYTTYMSFIHMRLLLHFSPSSVKKKSFYVSPGI